MASFPASIPVLSTFSSTSSLQPTDMNEAYRELEAICATLGVNPRTVDDTVAPGASPATVGTYLDMAANIAKSIAGVGAWYQAAVPLRSALLFNGGGSTIPATSIYWIGFGTVVAAASSGLVQLVAPVGCKIRWKTVRVQTLSASPSDDVIGFAIAVNGSLYETLYLKVGSPAGIYTFIAPKDYVDLTISGGDRIGVYCINNSASASAQIGSVSVEYEQNG